MTYRGITFEGMYLIAEALLETSELDQAGYDQLYFYKEEDLPYHYYILDQGQSAQITAQEASDLIEEQNYTLVNVETLPLVLLANTVYEIQEGVTFRQALLMTEPIPQNEEA